MNAIIRHAPAFFHALLDPALRALVLAALAGVTLRVFRVKHAPAQLIIWKGVLYASLVLPFLTFLLPPLSLRLPAKNVRAALVTLRHEEARLSRRLNNPQGGTRETRVRTADPAAGVPTRMVVARSLRSSHLTSVRAVSAGNSIDRAAVSGLTRESRKRAKSSPGFLSMLRPALTTVLVISIYGLGVLFLLGRLGVGLLLSHRLRRQSTAIQDPRALRWLKWHALAMGLEEPPVLAESKAVVVPLTFGALRPLILVPSDWRDWESGKLAAVIAHELSHVKRNDSLTRTLALLYRGIFWFSPLSWWLEGRLADLAEQASDAAALNAGTEPTYYAEILMSFFNVANAERRVNWQGVSMARGLRARKRIETVLSWNTCIPGRLRNTVLALLALCAVPIVLLTAATRPLLVAESATPAPAQVRAAQPPPPPAPPAPAVPAPADSAPPPPAAPSPAVANLGARSGPPPAAPASPDAPPPPAALSPYASPAPPAAPPSPAPPSATVRLPVYPGATRAPEKEGVGTVRLRNSTVRDLYAVRYISSDPPQKVLNYYRDELEAYGPIVQCGEGRNNAVYVDLDDDALANPTQCRSSEIGVGETELKVADGVERIVAVKAHGSGSEFALVTVRGASSEVYNIAPAVLTAVTPAAQVKAAVQMSLAVAASAKQVVRVAPDETDDSDVDIQKDDDETWTYSDTHGGMDFAIVSGKSININGSSDDRDEVRALQKKIPGDFIWFIHNGESYVIRDAGVVRTAKGLYAPMEELGRKQEALGKQQEELGRKQEALGKQQEGVRVKLPADLEARLKKVQDQLHRLAGTNASQEELADLQGELGDLQGELGNLQGEAGGQQGEFGRRQGELGSKQGELGRRQGELGREQGRLARQASRQMHDILRDALAKGQAQKAPQ